MPTTTEPPRSRRQEQGERTKERILDAATTLMAERGYAATPISAISNAAGVQPTSIYWAFDSKEGLFAAVLERAASSWFLDQAELATAPDLETYWARFRRLGSSFDDGPEFLRLLLVVSLERRHGDPEIVAAVQQVRAVGAAAVAAAVEPHVRLRDADVRATICQEIGRLAVLLLDGAFVARQIEPDTTSADELFRSITHTLAASLDAHVRAARASARTRGTPS